MYAYNYFKYNSKEKNMAVVYKNPNVISNKQDKIADVKKARELIEAAAKQGLEEAKVNLAILHDQGIGGPVDRESAFMLMKECARSGHLKAQFLLGLMYECGRGTPKNVQSAIFWYRKLVDLPNQFSTYKNSEFVNLATRRLSELETTEYQLSLIQNQNRLAITTLSLDIENNRKFDKIILSFIRIGNDFEIFSRAGKEDDEQVQAIAQQPEPQAQSKPQIAPQAQVVPQQPVQPVQPVQAVLQQPVQPGQAAVQQPGQAAPQAAQQQIQQQPRVETKSQGQAKPQVQPQQQLHGYNSLKQRKQVANAKLKQEGKYRR